MTSRLPKHNDRGFTLVEMLVVIAIVGIVMAIATPSLLSLNKPLREGTLQFKNQLNLIRARAIASNQAYRIRPKYESKAQYTGQSYQQTPHNFIVEYAANCKVTKYGSAATGSTAPDGWQRASQFDLDLPETIGIDGTAQVNGNNTTTGSETITPANGGSSSTVTYNEANLNWKICYDNRGIADKSVSITLKDFQANNQAKSAKINISKIGGVEIETYSTNDASGTKLPANPNPTF
jgi:prepilin-type N-terminal cleavage/methylation domain-containing protein